MVALNTRLLCFASLIAETLEYSDLYLNQTVYSMSSFPCQASMFLNKPDIFLQICTHLCIDFYDLLKNVYED